MTNARAISSGILLLALATSASAQDVQAYLGRTVEPGSGGKISLSVWGASSVEVKEYRLNATQLDEAIRSSNRLSIDPAQHTATRTVSFSGQRGEVDVASRAGVYVYVATGQGVSRTSAQAVLVSDLKMAVKRDDDSSLFLIQQGDAIAGRTSIKVYEAADAQTKPTVLRTYRSRNGLAYLRTASTKNLIYVARIRGHVAIQTGYDRTWQANRNRFQVHVQTDRPIYRPGHTVNFKAIVREKAGDRAHRTPRDEEVRVFLRDPQSNRTLIATLKTNKYGTVAGSTTVDEGSPLGNYGIEFEVGAAQTQQVTHGYGNFGVEAYRKPEYKVSVNPTKAQVVMGSPVVAEIEGRYFFGAPVADADVSYTVTKRNRWRFWNPWIRPLVYRAMPSLWWPTWRNEVVSQGSGKLNAQGKLIVTVPTTRADSDADYEITAKVTDASNREVSGGGSVAVTRAAFDLMLGTDRYCYEPGDLVTLRANVQTTDGATPGPVAVTFKIEEFQKDGTKVFRFDRTRVTDASGEAELRLRATNQNRYQITATAQDADGNEISAQRTIWIADETGSRDWSFDQVELIADKDAYEPGDEALILVRGPVTSGYGLITVEGDSIKRAFGVRLYGGLGLVRIRVDESMTPNAFVSIMISGDDGVVTANKEINVPPVNKIVDVQIVADKAEYRPGETATFRLKATDSNGRPVQAEVALGIVDEALFALREDATPELITTFFPKGHNRVHTMGASGGWGRGGGFFPGGPVFMATAAESTLKSADAGQGQSKVREYFPDTMTWLAQVETDQNGEAVISQELADSLTTWRLTARAVTESDELGQTVTTTLVRKDLIVRLAAPRALVEGDILELKGIIHNLAQEGTAGAENASVRVRLEASGVDVLGAASRTLIVPRDGQGEVTWRVRVREGKLAELTLHGNASFDQDALRLKLPIAARGVALPRAVSGSLTQDGTERFSLFKAPGAIDGATDLEITLTPSLAGTLLDTVEYLADYPYGCIEQTMSRFLPTLMVAEVLERIGKPSQKLKDELPKMVKAGIEKVRGHQNADGGYGWFGSHRASHPYVSAYVAYGLALAKQQGYDVPAETWTKLVTFLEGSLNDAQNTDLDGRAYQVFVLAEGGVFRSADMISLASQKDRLGAYGKAVLTMALERSGRGSMARDMLASLAQAAVLSNGRAHWPGDTLRYGNWTSNPIETTAYALRAFLTVDGQNTLVRQAMTWLLTRRQGKRWTTTKDTAAVVLAFSHYVKVTGELNPDMDIVVEVNGTQVTQTRFTSADLGKKPLSVTVPAGALVSGANEVVIRRQGRGALYFTALLNQWVRMNPITAADNGISVTRDYFVVSERLVNGQIVEDEAPFTGTVRVGQRIRVKLTLNVSKAGDVEHVNFEDRFPSGFEVVETPRRAWGWWGYWRSAKEVHDDKVVFFATRLNRWAPSGMTAYSYTYDMRAETPGTFLALPAYAEAVYTPETHGRTAATEVVIRNN